MNILMLGPWLPTTRRPLTNERLHQFARHLAREHRLTLACATDHPNPFAAVSALREDFDDLEFAVVPNRWKRIWSVANLAAGSSAEVAYFSSAALRTRIRDRARTTPFELVYVASTSMIPYALDLAPAVPVVVDFGDLDSEWWQERSRRFSGLKARVYEAEAERLRAVEILAARQAAHCLVSTPKAAKLMNSFMSSASVTVIAEGVELDEPSPPARSGAAPVIAFNPCLERDSDARAAIKFCDEVLPRVHTRVGRIKLLIGCRSLFPLAKRLTHLPGVEVAAPLGSLRGLFRRATSAPQEIEGLRTELRDRFGPLPVPAEAMLALAQLRIIGGALGIEGILVRGNEARITFRDSAAPRVKGLSAAFHDVQFQAEVRRAVPLSLKLTRLGGAPLLEGLVRALRGLVS